MDYIRITLTNFKKPDADQSFDCITYEIEKNYYKFYLSAHDIKYVPMYDFTLDITYPWEVENPKAPESKKE